MSDPSSEPPAPAATFARTVLAVLATGAALAGYITLAVLFSFEVLDPFRDWVERRSGVVYYVCKAVWIVLLLTLFALARVVAAITWDTFAPPSSEAPRSSGRHAKWHPGKEAEDADRAAKQCPKCESSFEWDGAKCGHCGYELPGRVENKG